MTLTSVPGYDSDRLDSEQGTAVVVGAGIAGLSATRVLSDGFERVILVDRDSFPDRPDPRRGVPQAAHAHVLLEAGRATLEDLFPGFGHDVVEAGGAVLDMADDVRHYEQGGVLAGTTTELPMYCATRPLFEHVLRRRATGSDGVTVRSRCRVTDYLVDGSENVTGVALCDQEGESTELSADLVVDATGRCSRTPTWLQEHGYAAPAVDEVSVDLTYSTVVVDRPADDRRAVLVLPSSPRTRGGVAIPVEGDRWQVTLAGVHGDSPPTEYAGFRDFAASLPVADLEAILAGHERVSDDVAHYPFPSNLRRRYEDLERFPDGLVVIGDGIASFNPIYGQGMSVAALEALLLHQELAAGGRENLATRFFDRAGTLVDTVWLISVGADFEFTQTAGPKPRGTTLFNRYLSRLVRGAHSDGALADAFYRVLRLEQSPTTLLRPGVAWRVLRPI